MRFLLPIVTIAVAVAVAGCRGSTSKKPPVHLNPNMDLQERYEPHAPSGFFVDGRTMRTPPVGTVARGFEKRDTAVWAGKSQGGGFVTDLPFEVDEDLYIGKTRGRERYGIYCAPCHDAAGTGNGVIVQKGMTKPPSYMDARLRAMPAGEIYSAIANGVKSMPTYGHQIPLADRWAIVAYVRILQRKGGAAPGGTP